MATWPDTPSLEYLMDAGSGTTIDDTIGTNDGTLESGGWNSNSNGFGGYTINCNGGTGITASSLGYMDGFGGMTSCSVALTIDGNHGSTECIWQTSDGTGVFSLSISSNGDLIGGYYDGSSWGDSAGRTGVPSTPFRVVVTVDTNSNFTLYVTDSNGNQSSYTTSFGSDGIGSVGGGLYIGSNGGGNKAFTGQVDGFVAYDDELSSSQVTSDFEETPMAVSAPTTPQNLTVTET